jgi:sec-independent protein translocase protein TatA
MGGTSIWHWLVVGVIVMLLFGRGKLSELMGDAAKGIKAFKKGMSEEETASNEATPAAPAGPVKTLEHQPASPTTSATPAATGTTLGERKVG